ncbi:calmodulin-regulated spectrin-associated protein 2-like protein [Leptotrombidium deliense]|uniref:Calmodulin-regulated spectrin-associated protein 2-like protein n=1 Tax=Leptotrombidium deliense TaxID=299467 RepID=A0A443SRP7_9ACAR|nr:calmodulin-regulated spectrin-associated protein 2-like protein [Leptotrombidium deliense]
MQAKQKSSILWILSKAYNNEIPPDLLDPYYKDNEEQDKLKPQIVQSLANTEIYCLSLSNIYADPNYSCLNHHEIMQLLMRKGIYVVEPNDTSLTETVLLQTAPIRLSAHMVIIEAIMALYIKEVLIPEKLVEVVSRFIAIDPEEPLPSDPEEAAIFWMNKSCIRMKQRMDDELFHLGNDNVVSPPLLVLEDLADLSDGCSLATLLSFYCPEQLNWTEICFNESMGMADSIYNLQLVQYFCQEKLPHNICFLSLEDFLYLHETIRPNVLAFIADLLFLFEIKPSPFVRRPGTKEELGFSDSEEETFKGLPDLPTPAEMKSKSLQHSGWANSDYRNSREDSKSQRSFQRSLRRLERSDEEDTFQHCSMESGVPSDRYPDVIFSKPYDTVSVSNFSKPLTKYKFQELQRSHSASKSRSPTRSEKSDTVSDISSVEKEKHSPTLTTNFMKISRSKDVNGSQSENHSENQTTPVINIAFKQKDANEYSMNSIRASQKPFQLNDGSSIKDIFNQKPNQTNIVEQEKSSDDVQTLLRDIRLKLEAKRHKLEAENKNVNQAWKQQALLKAVKTQKDDKEVEVKDDEKCNGGGDNVDVEELKHDLEEMSKRLAEHEKLSTLRRVSNSDKQTPDKKIDPESASEAHQQKPNYNAQHERFELNSSEIPSSLPNQIRFDNSSQHLGNSPHAAAFNEPQMIPKRSKWGQPSVPFAANDLEYQWTVASIPPQVEHPFYPRYPANPYEHMYSMHMYPTHAPLQPRSVYGYQHPETYYRPHLPPQTSNHGHPIYSQPNEMYRTPDNRDFVPFSPPTHHLNYSQNVGSNVNPPTVVEHNEDSLKSRNRLLNQSVNNESRKLKDSRSNHDLRKDLSNTFQERSPTLTQTITRSSHRTSSSCEPSQGINRKKSVDSEASSSDSIHNKNGSSSDSLSNKDDDLTFTQKGFFIHFGDDDSKPKPKPAVRPKLRSQQKPQLAIESDFTRQHENHRESVKSSKEKKPSNEVKLSPVSQGVGFVIGQDLVDPDPCLELEMAKKKEKKKEEASKKKEEERLRRQIILEQYRQRKIQEEADKNGLSGAVSSVSSKDSSRNNTVVLHRPARGRPNSSGTKPRPKSYHVSASQMQDFVSLDPKASRITDDVDAVYNFGSSMSSVVGSSCSRPQSALSGTTTMPRRLPSPPSRLPAIPSNLLGRHRGPPSDGASDAGSTFSEYTGPKLFVKPTQKSNRGLIINASNVVLAGAVNAETKKRVLEEINVSDSKHFVILFRGAGMQFRAIYSYNPDREEVFKLYGTGPKTINNDMIDKFYKYNSGTKSFNEVQTKHLTVTIDAFTIHNTLWSGKRMSTKNIF